MSNPSREPFSEDFSIVFLGRMNAAIFHPQWLGRHGLVGEEEAATAEIVVVSSQLSEFTVGPLSVHCEENKLQIRCDSEVFSDKVFDLAMGIIRLLPHTPFEACGINASATFQFSEDYWHQIGHTLVPKDPIWNDLCEKPGMLKLIIRSPFSGWTYPLEENVSLDPFFFGPRRAFSLAVRANCHFTLPEEESKASMIESFLQDRWEVQAKRAREIAAKIFENVKEKDT